MKYKYLVTTNLFNFRYKGNERSLTLKEAHFIAKSASEVTYILRIRYDVNNDEYVARVLGFYNVNNVYIPTTITFSC